MQVQMCRTTQRVTVCLVAVAAVALWLSGVEPCDVGIYADSPWWHRFTYQFAHKNAVHLCMNCYCLYIGMRRFNISLPTLLLCYLVSATSPVLSAVPTIGISGVVYALFGYINNLVARKWYFAMWIAVYIGVMALFGTNAVVHIYCYVVGLLIGYGRKRFGH